jgi:hypothetical protein
MHNGLYVCALFFVGIYVANTLQINKDSAIIGGRAVNYNDTSYIKG